MFAGLVRAAALPLVEGYINRRVPSEQRATILSLNHMGFALLVVPTLPLLGFAVDEWGVRWTFGGVAVVMAALSVVIGIAWMHAHGAQASRRTDEHTASDDQDSSALRATAAERGVLGD